VSDEIERLDRAAEVNGEHREVRIVDGVVERPATAGTETAHSFLRHLRDQGVDCAPEPVGVVDGVESLRLIEGADGGEGWYHQHTDRGLASAARLLRRIHDASAGWVPPEGAVWGAPVVPAADGEDLVLCHGDPGPWNFVWRDQEAVALIDWDYLHPGPRLHDVSYALRWFAPLRSDEMALEWHHFPEVPDRRARVATFVEAYGDLPAFDVVGAVTGRIRDTMALVRSLAEQGQEPQRTWVAEGSLDDEAREIGWILEQRALLA